MEWGLEQLKKLNLDMSDQSKVDKFLDLLLQERITMPQNCKISLKEIEFHIWIKEQLEAIAIPEDQSAISYVVYK